MTGGDRSDDEYGTMYGVCKALADGLGSTKSRSTAAAAVWPRSEDTTDTVQYERAGPAKPTSGDNTKREDRVARTVVCE